MYGYMMDKHGNSELFAYPAAMPFAMHQGATPDGKMIVGYYMEAGATRSYILSDEGTVTTFAVPGAARTAAQDINQDGLIVGIYRNPGESSAVYHGFVVDTTLSMDQSKWTYTYPVDFPGSSKTMIRGVSARGDIVGDYLGADGKTHGFVATLARGNKVSDWSSPVNLGPVINTSNFEGCPCITKDGLSLYLASFGRADSKGWMDLYVSQRKRVKDPWGTPKNLGGVINTGANERCPYVTPDGRYLIFVSDRAGGSGLGDFYVSTRRDKNDDFGWGPPENITAINSPADVYAAWGFEMKGAVQLYFSSNITGVGP